MGWSFVSSKPSPAADAPAAGYSVFSLHYGPFPIPVVREIPRHGWAKELMSKHDCPTDNRPTPIPKTGSTQTAPTAVCALQEILKRATARKPPRGSKPSVVKSIEDKREKHLGRLPLVAFLPSPASVGVSVR